MHFLIQGFRVEGKKRVTSLILHKPDQAEFIDRTLFLFLVVSRDFSGRMLVNPECLRSKNLHSGQCR